MKKVNGVIGFKSRLPVKATKGFLNDLPALFFKNGEIVQATKSSMTHTDLIKAYISNYCRLLPSGETVAEKLGLC